MIKKTLLFTLLLLAGYAIAIKIFTRSIQIVQHQWQGNVIRAQSFIYDNRSDSFQNVIVGSSLSNRLLMDSLPGYYNLSFNGQSIFDGLAILQHKKILPKNLFIETNVVLKKEDERFTASLFNPFLYYLRLYVPSLRDGKQPLAITGWRLSLLLNSIFSRNETNAEVKTADNAHSKQSELFLRILDNQVRIYAKVPEQALVDQSLAELQRHITALEQKGVHIIFFEMPVNKELCNLPLSVTLRDIIAKKFPAGKYDHIVQPGCADYITTDGLHLNEEEAVRYTNYFRQQAANLIK